VGLGQYASRRSFNERFNEIINVFNGGFDAAASGAVIEENAGND
jgi:hypothetical protein